METPACHTPAYLNVHHGVSLAKERLKENTVGNRSIFVHLNPYLYLMKTTIDLLKDDLAAVNLFGHDLAFFLLHRGSPRSVSQISRRTYFGQTPLVEHQTAGWLGVN